jgi:hypothetical protein
MRFNVSIKWFVAMENYIVPEVNQVIKAHKESRKERSERVSIDSSIDIFPTATLCFCYSDLIHYKEDIFRRFHHNNASISHYTPALYNSICS